MPQLLDRVLRGPDLATVDVASLARQDARAWWLVAVAAVLLLGTAVLAAVRSPRTCGPGSTPSTWRSRWPWAP